MYILAIYISFAVKPLFMWLIYLSLELFVLSLLNGRRYTYIILKLIPCKLRARCVSAPTMQLVFKMSNKQKLFNLINVLVNSFYILYKNKLFFSHYSISAGGQSFRKLFFLIKSLLDCPQRGPCIKSKVLQRTSGPSKESSPPTPKPRPPLSSSASSPSPL